MKKSKGLMVITMLAALVLAGTSVINSKASELNFKEETMITETASVDLCDNVFEGYNQGRKGPMSITKGILKYNNINYETEVYVVCLAGTEDVEGQSTNLTSDIQSAFGLSNDYMVNVKNHMFRNIPSGSKVILSGHSLGGMVAQQLSSDESMKANFQIIRTITFGAPLVSPSNKEGVVKRFVDKADIIPAFSVSAMVEKVTKRYEYQVVAADSGDFYDNKVILHQATYGNAELWEGYDFIGQKNGNTSFSYYEDDKVFYHCPVIE